MPKRTRKKHRKKPPKNRFLPPFGPPKTHPNRIKIAKKRPRGPLEKKLEKMSYGTHRTAPDRTGRQAFWDPARLSNYLSND